MCCYARLLQENSTNTAHHEEGWVKSIGKNTPMEQEKLQSYPKTRELVIL